MTILLDGRTEAALKAELLRRAQAVMARADADLPPAGIARAILTVAARIEEEVTRRLDHVPNKQANNFYAAMGQGRDPARPARMPIAFKLADPSPAGLEAPRGTRLIGGAETIIFETEEGIALANGTIAAMAAVDLVGDRIMLPPPGVIDAALPRTAALRRAAAGGVGAGTDIVQVNPVTDLVNGMEIAIGAGDAARNHGIVAVENDRITITPPLAATVGQTTPILVVDHFAPFAPPSRNRQEHALYLGHKTALNVPSALTLVVSGFIPPDGVTWSWWGEGAADAPPGWQAFVAVEAGDGRLALTKAAGKPVARAVDGRESLWIRALLDGPSGATIEARDIRIGVKGSAACAAPIEDRCAGEPTRIDYEAIAVTTPVVPNQPYHPFGRQPRIYDSFYVGCAEAFSKAGAEVSLCFTLGGADLGPLAAVGDGTATEIFGVGSDGLLYRADFRTVPPQFQPVPPQTVAGEIVTLPPHAAIDAQLSGGTVRIAAADVRGGFQMATLDFGARLSIEAVQWQQVAGAATDPEVRIDRLLLSQGADNDPILVRALAGRTLLSWMRAPNGWQPPVETPDVDDLVPVQNMPGAALLITRRAADPAGNVSAGWNVDVVRPGWATPERIVEAGLSELPRQARAAWMEGTGWFLAGFDPPDLWMVRIDTGSIVVVGTGRDIENGAITFESRPVDGGVLPPMRVAGRVPRRVFLLSRTLVATRDAGEIGARAGARGFVHGISQQRNFVAVQHVDQGLLYRFESEQQTQPLRVSGAARLVVPADAVPDAARYLVFGTDAAGPGFALVASAAGDRLLDPLWTGSVVGDPDQTIVFSDAGGGWADLTIDQGEIVLAPPLPTGDVDVRVQPINAAGAVIGDELWTLTKGAGLAANRWDMPAGFPANAGGNFRYRPLRREAQQAVTLIDYFQPGDPARLARILRDTALRALYANVPVTRLVEFGTMSLFAFDPVSIEGGDALLIAEPDSWQLLGPVQPANPALSWEYWNGRSWWALDGPALRDQTAQLLTNGGVFFTVPADLAETDVGGRKNHWIRARLIGGDYGEARTTIVTTDLGQGKTRQEVERDLSAIRAPYIVSLRLGYCMNSLVPPQIVLTADNLATIDQTGANDAGLIVPVFPPVSKLMTPSRIGRVPPPDFAETCDPPCPPAEAAEPDVDAPSAARALLLAFDQPVRGTPVSIHVDVVPTGRITTLQAEILVDGAFRSVRIMADHSLGLNEAGSILLDVPDAPDKVALFGVTAHWLRLSPGAAEAGAWSPRLRGVYLNAVMARSVETRTLGMLGSSSGAPGQTFRLAEGQVAAGSLELRIREPLGIDERATLDARDEVGGMTGPWVRWRETDALEDAEPGARVFVLDAESGVVRFGDARHGAIPPLGAAVLAVDYRHVAGAAANGVGAGAVLQLLSPIAGVETVTALDVAAGGIDVEAAASARARAAAKLRHGDRILSLADIEDRVRADQPMLAQVRATMARGGVTLVVATRGAEPAPVPAVLREIGAGLRAVATYGLAVSGRLSVVAPRLLPIGITLTIIPDDLGDFTALDLLATRALVALFDPATGGFDGKGWPIGTLPVESDIAAALDVLSDRAVLADVAIARRDRDPPEPLPDGAPPTALVRLDPAAVTVRLLLDAPA